ncbi:MAG: HD domain-containing protein [Candidatus Sulfobium sp.]|jgi:putative nucleotidyltransferase with HDIG domain
MTIELKRALYNISALADLGKEITSEKDFGDKIQSVLYVIMGTFLANRGAIFWYEKEKRKIIPIARRGFDRKGSPKLKIRLGHVLPMKKNEPYSLADGEGTAAFHQFRDGVVQTGAEIFVPLWVRDEFIGLIVLSRKFTSASYSPEDFELLKVIANQIAITINHHMLFMDLSRQLDENKRLYEQMRRIYHDTIQAFAAAIDAKDVYTRNHSQRVAKYSVAIARELGWEESDVEGIYIAGFLHDVGKLIISNELLNKKEALTDRELLELRRHPALSYKILSKIKFPWKNVVTMVKHHHERLDGRGYPSALMAQDLDEGVKILTLADSFDAMTSERAYRDKLDLREALVEVKRCLDTQFDGKIVAAFCRVLEKEIRGDLPEPNILPHLGNDFDPTVITGLLEALIRELSV